MVAILNAIGPKPDMQKMRQRLARRGQSATGFAVKHNKLDSARLQELACADDPLSLVARVV